MRKMHADRLIACAGLTVISMMIATVALAQAPPQPPQPKIPPAPVPSSVVDLMTAEGIQAFEGRWKTTEAKIVEGPALPNSMPGYKTSYACTPHPGETC